MLLRNDMPDFSQYGVDGLIVKKRLDRMTRIIFEEALVLTDLIDSRNKPCVVFEPPKDG